MLGASPWLVAVDADGAGEVSASGWLDRSRRCRRVPPPGGFKDWSAAFQGGVGLRRWWSDRLAGVENPPLYTWPQLATWRWGPGGPEPGLVVDRPDLERMVAALSAAEGRTDA
jgi:hypothetical protein